MLMVRATHHSELSAFNSVETRQKLRGLAPKNQKTKLVLSLQHFQEINGKAIVGVCKDEREGVYTWALDPSR